MALMLVTATAQEAAAQDGGFQGEINQIQNVAAQKYMGLANVLNAEQYSWRPDDGVRSVAEVLTHVAGNNYWLMAYMGAEIPNGVPITAAYNSVVEFEKQTDRDDIIRQLEESFEYMEATIAAVPDDRLDDAMDIFGNPGTVRAYLSFVSAHLHEHLGQLIAYTRSNGVTPPWSN